jgi:hypothetical protein
MPEPHQSRVFTFIGTRTNQLKNTCARGLRQLRVAVIWSGQILLYPLHLLAQTKIFQPQIPAPPPSPVLPQPVPDINIEQALDLVEVAGHSIQTVEKIPLVVDDWSYIDENLWNTSLGSTAVKSQEITYSPRKSDRVIPLKPIIRGISSLLTDRQLVLVTTTNDLLNILTLAEQQDIRRRIGLDLATSWDEWHTDKLTGHHPAKELSSNSQLLLTSEPIATTDRQLPPENLFDRLRNWFQTSTVKPQSLDLPLQPEIIAPTEPTVQPQLAPSAYTFTPQPPKFERYLELPQLPPISEPHLPKVPDPGIKLAITNIITQLQPDWLKRWWNYYREYVYIPSEDESAIVYQPEEEFQLIPIEPTPSQIKAKHQLKSDQSTKQQLQIEQTRSIKHPTKFTQNLEYHQDWIEAESEPIGYSQSILARLLAWLDRLMFRFENWMISIFTAITDRFKIDS